jgi:hypothetical protein
MDKKSGVMGTNENAVKWALTRNQEGKSTLSPYQVRKMRKTISPSKSTRKPHKVKDGSSSSSKQQVSTEDLSKLKEIADKTSALIEQATDILKNYK